MVKPFNKSILMHDVFERCESGIRSYCRSFPAVFQKGRGAMLYDENGHEYLDFFAGAGTLNYGHNNPAIKQAIMDYLAADGVTHSLDMWTVAKRTFLETFESVILKPRGLDYKLQFTGPTGTNAVEAALKLARKVTNRGNIICFTNGYHGLSAGALSITGNRHFRNEAFVNRLDATFLPFDGYFGDQVNTLDYLRKMLTDSSSGVDIPAAIILETIQAEGGINVAHTEWLRGLEALCREFDILLIVDDIQVGNGRTGTFFSFEPAGIRPDIVVLSKSIGGLGLPMSLVLIDPKIDLWKPAEHTGTFRGNNLAFVGATAALEFWRTEEFATEIRRKSVIMEGMLNCIKERHPNHNIRVRGRGLIYGLEMPAPAIAKSISQEAFRQRMIIELAGPNDEVVKFLPPLVIEEKSLRHGLETISQIVSSLLK